MSVIPQTTLEALEFCEQHWPIWNAAPASVGLLPATVLAIKTATQDCRAKYDAANLARQASKSATETLQL